MEEFITFINAVGGTGIPTAALIGFGIWAIIFGKLTPKATVDDRINDKDAEIDRLRTDRDARYQDLSEERDDWKQAYDDTNTALVEVRRQNAQLLEVARTSKHVLESLPQADHTQSQAHVTTPYEGGEDSGITQGP